MINTKHFLLISMLLCGSLLRFGSTFYLRGSSPNDSEENPNFFEGDIVRNRLSGKSGILDPSARWTDGMVPYRFHVNYDETLKGMALKAMDHITMQTGNCVRFVERTNESDYIEIASTPYGCFSYVGKVGGKQTVSLPKDCSLLGIHIHEMMHALGFWHEHNRSDRDKYVEIYLDNVIKGMESNFEKYSIDEVTDYGIPYDYGSVMHYGATAFSRNGLPTILPKEKDVFIGQRTRMSEADKQKVKSMYGCN